MQRNNLALFAIIFIPLLIIDWILGAAQAAGAIPLWTFLIPNIPFGFIYVWMESSWAQTHYNIFGHRLGDYGSMAIFLGVVIAQASFYFLLAKHFLRKKREQVALS